ncbi:flavin reductase (NADPH) [Eupeodes corollae]|uniref:flavin reductase (NADPH) n=1 Tax=Eupeodes corollae TaxID=290404 RepID=UPI0024929896|nr:flavin reductase (NADPH) [Eupeodes corollae]
MGKIAIIGGTGMTGKCVVELALQKGLNVRLLYRTEETVPESFKGKVDLVKGDATKLEDVKNVLEGVDAVCVTLGTRNKLEPTTEMSTGTKNIIDAMKELNIKRFSIIMSSFLFMNPEQVPKMFHNINEDHLRMLDLTKNSGLDYIAILPPHIADEPSGEVTILHDSSPGRAVSKYDLAKFIVDSLDQPEHYGKVCGIAKKAPA